MASADAPKTAPELIAEAVATRLCVVLPLPKTEEDSEFDRECHAELAKIEEAFK